MEAEEFEARVQKLKEADIDRLYAYTHTARSHERAIVFEKHKIKGDKVELMMKFFDGWSSIDVPLSKVKKIQANFRFTNGNYHDNFSILENRRLSRV